MTSMKYAGGAALTGGAASAANMLFGVSVIGLLVFQFARSTLLGKSPCARMFALMHLHRRTQQSCLNTFKNYALMSH